MFESVRYVRTTTEADILQLAGACFLGELAAAISEWLRSECSKYRARSASESRFFFSAGMAIGSLLLSFSLRG